MNIKGFIQSALNISPANAVDKVQKKERAIKSDQTEERDGNGQEFYSKNKKKNKMSEEQFNKAMDLLRKKHFMVEMKWTVEFVLESDLKIAEIKNESGEVIRRLSEYDLWELFEDQSVETHKGQLLKKSA